MTGNVLIVVDDLLTEGELSNDMKVEAVAVVIESILPQPFEDGINKLGLPEAGKTVLRGQRDGVFKATVDLGKQEATKALNRADQEQQNSQTADSCNENDDKCSG